ncbi:HdeD family acid-resistance protein [Pseudomonas sp. O39]|uniref:HdeD family acid-resistance protein n=1 Tax=Pseudomonas sp. O39 TaxID=3379130 RepID=UPI00387A9D64
MVRLVMLLLGVDYLRSNWHIMTTIGAIFALSGSIVFIDALDGALYFPISLFAWLLLIEGSATLIVAHSGIGGQRKLRYLKGFTFVIAASLILAGHHHGNFILSIIFGTLFLIDGLLQIISAYVVRYRTWRLAISGGVVELALAVFFFQPYPTNYIGTVPFCLGLGLFFAGWNMLIVSGRVRRMTSNPALTPHSAIYNPEQIEKEKEACTNLIEETSRALTIHIWTPVGVADGEVVHRPLIERYIAAVDKNGVISTGHAALEAPNGLYVSLYPAEDIDHSPDEFVRMLRATEDNNMPGEFQPDYLTESQAWCPSTVKVRIFNYDLQRLGEFWEEFRKDTTYNLTHRNCSSSVIQVLEAAVEGSVGRICGQYSLYRTLGIIFGTPELWVAIQIRKRAQTMAWTPGLALDYTRALSMLVDPKPTGWINTSRRAFKKISSLRRQWKQEKVLTETSSKKTQNAGKKSV